jgi:hypothetical protein
MKGFVASAKLRRNNTKAPLWYANIEGGFLEILAASHT